MYYIECGCIVDNNCSGLCHWLVEYQKFGLNWTTIKAPAEGASVLGDKKMSWAFDQGEWSRTF